MFRCFPCIGIKGVHASAWPYVSKESKGAVRCSVTHFLSLRRVSLLHLHKDSHRLALSHQLLSTRLDSWDAFYQRLLPLTSSQE